MRAEKRQWRGRITPKQWAEEVCTVLSLINARSVRDLILYLLV